MPVRFQLHTKSHSVHIHASYTFSFMRIRASSQTIMHRHAHSHFTLHLFTQMYTMDPVIYPAVRTATWRTLAPRPPNYKRSQLHPQLHAQMDTPPADPQLPMHHKRHTRLHNELHTQLHDPATLRLHIQLDPHLITHSHGIDINTISA